MELNLPKSFFGIGDNRMLWARRFFGFFFTVDFPLPRFAQGRVKDIFESFGKVGVFNDARELFGGGYKGDFVVIRYQFGLWR